MIDVGTEACDIRHIEREVIVTGRLKSVLISVRNFQHLRYKQVRVTRHHTIVVDRYHAAVDFGTDWTSGLDEDIRGAFLYAFHQVRAKFFHVENIS